MIDLEEEADVLINNANKDDAWKHWHRSTSKGLQEYREGKSISTENIRRAVLAEEGINMTHCFILTTSKEKNAIKTLD